MVTTAAGRRLALEAAVQRAPEDVLERRQPVAARGQKRADLRVADVGELDLHGSADYRRALTREVVRRALVQLAGTPTSDRTPVPA